MNTPPLENAWAVLLSSSPYYHNYRHLSNILSLYVQLKRFGFSDDRIIVMSAFDAACDDRNVHRGVLYSSIDNDVNVYRDDIEIDYKGSEVNVNSFIQLLNGRHSHSVPLYKRLLSDENSNVLM